MTNHAYQTLDSLLSSLHREKPETLDALTFSYKGISVNAYGVLHALTGGTNADYVSAVNRTIAQARGLKLGEKEFTSIYKGLDGELKDWAQIGRRDAFKTAWSTIGTPARLYQLIRTIVVEKTRLKDPFDQGDRRLQSIGGSLHFHTIDPFIRRKVAGFPDAETYLRVNLDRRRGQRQWEAPLFPDRDWGWLAGVEPVANIACRSIHMLEFGVEFAKRRGEKELSLFVGEIHNSDMAWFAQAMDIGETFSNDHLREIQDIRDRAIAMAEAESQNTVRGKLKLKIEHVKYLVFLYGGSFSVFGGYLLGILLLMQMLGFTGNPEIRL